MNFDPDRFEELGPLVHYLSVRSLILLAFLALVFTIAATATHESTVVSMTACCVPVTAGMAFFFSYVSTRSRKLFQLKWLVIFGLLEGLAISIGSLFLIKLGAQNDPWGFLAAPFAFLPGLAGILAFGSVFYLINVNETDEE